MKKPAVREDDGFIKGSDGPNSALRYLRSASSFSLALAMTSSATFFGQGA